MQKRYWLTGMAMLSASLSAHAVSTNIPYQLCAGFPPAQQSCQPYPGQHACQQALHACQTAPNQVKPWLCGRCEIRPATSLVVYEVVGFDSKPTVSVTQMQQAAQKIQPLLKSMPGFIGRYFAVRGQHHFVDFVIWRNMHDALYAAQKVQSYPLMQQFDALIVPASVNMQHARALVIH